MKLSVEDYHSGDTIVIHCAGRLVFREEAAVLSRVVGEALQRSQEVILNLAGVRDIDSAGLGELVLVHMMAENRRKTMKLAGANARVRELLDLTNLSLVFEIYARLEDALEAYEMASSGEERRSLAFGVRAQCIS